MISLILGAFTIGLGLKGFSAAGLPWSKTRNLTGRNARIIGGLCVGLGALFLLDGLLWVVRFLGAIVREFQ